MRIVCPACSAAYDVADALLARGRRVRCVRCGQEWQPEAARAAVAEPHWPDLGAMPPAPVEPDIEYEPAPRFTAMDRLASSRAEARRRPLLLLLAWAASIAVLLGLCGAGYAWRAELVQVWPPSARVYSALGLMPNGAGPR